TSKWDPTLMNNKMIHIHSDRAAFSRSPMARLHVQGSIKTVFAKLNERLEDSNRKFPQSGNFDPEAAARTAYVPVGIEVQRPHCCRPAVNGELLKAPQVYYELIRRLPRETRFFIDNSNSVPWSIHYFFHSRPESYHLSIEFATMAWAVGAAIGGAFANQSAPSVCIAGDGCYLMSAQEITVAVEQQLPVLFVVLDDQAYGLIRHGHRFSGKETVEYRIPPVDFAMMARATGAKSHTIRGAKDFEMINWQELALHQGPTLLHVLIDPEEPPPLAMA
ncbi:MAG: thiamine pyrophosphate-binding protein, partial [Geobacter sp.]